MGSGAMARLLMLAGSPEYGDIFRSFHQKSDTVHYVSRTICFVYEKAVLREIVRG